MTEPGPRPTPKPPGPWKRFWDWFDQLSLVAKTVGSLMLVGLVILMAVTLLSTSLDDPEFSGSVQVDSYMAEFGGDRDVYIRILTAETCDRLRDELAGSTADHEQADPDSETYRATLGYMNAAEDQIAVRACPG